MVNLIIIACGIIALVVVVLLVIVALQPATFTIQRTITTAAPPAAVFPLVNDFHKWASWSPWEKMDPNLKRTFTGPASGTGSIYDWTGNKQVGQGRMTILHSRSPDRLLIKLEFIKPFSATNETEFTFQPLAGQTLISWTMTGHKNFMMKCFHLMMNMDKIIGTDFERGLMEMKAQAEAARLL